MPTFWRVLDDAPTIDPDTHESKVNQQSTKRRWERGEYNSTHKSVPSEWRQMWIDDVTDPDDYDLECNTGLHTEAALDAFLTAAAEHGVDGEWTESEKIRVGELDGTCAWATKLEAWHYVLGKLPEEAIEDCTISEVKLAVSSVVEFTADDLGFDIPEGNQPDAPGGGRQVRVTQPGFILSAQEFAEQNGFPIPWEEGEAPELSYPGEDDEPYGDIPVKT